MTPTPKPTLDRVGRHFSDFRNFEYQSLHLDPQESYTQESSRVLSMPLDIDPFGTPHAPIVINENNDFETQNWPGEGTVEQPYIIAGLNINSTITGGPAINITNTDVHFFVMDCWLTSNETSVIEFNSVIHGRIKNNTILNSERGVVALHSSDLTVNDNLFYSFGWAGVYLEDCTLSTLENNNCTTCFIGLHIEQSNNIFIEENYCFNCLGGIELYLNCEYVTVFNNTAINNDVGIGLYLNCENNLIDSNNCTSNVFAGIYSQECPGNTIESNFGRNNDADIFLQNCTSHVISGNDCGWGSEASFIGSIALHNSNNSIIMKNQVENTLISIEIAEGSSYNEISNNNCTIYAGAIVIWNNAPHNTAASNLCTGLGFGEVDIYIENSHFNEISENQCNQSYYNIVIAGSNSTNVTDNQCFNSQEGSIMFDTCYYALAEGNTLANGSSGIGLLNTAFGTVKDNTIVNFTGIWSGGFAGIHLDSVSNSSIIGNYITKCNTAIYMQQSNECNITGNTCVDNQDGIFVVISNFDIFIEDNYCQLTTSFAILVAESYNCTVVRNVCTNTTGEEGICLGVYDAQCDASWNEFRFSSAGIDFEGHKGVITHNIIKDNDLFGLYTLGLLDVNVTWNVFDNNGENVRDDSLTTIFDYNYYSNYTGVDANADGIGDTWHPIAGSANNNDTHPLMYYPTAPTWLEEPTDQQAEYGEEFTCSISVFTSPKLAPITEWWINDSHFVIDDGIISNGLVLSFGDYPLEVRASNLYGYSVSGTFKVTVVDTVAPSIIGPDDFEYVVDQVGRWITWIAEDHDPESYRVTLDGIETMSGAWNSTAENVTINVDGLSVGNHIFMITFIDGSGNSGSDTVVVTVKPIDFTPLLIVAGAGFAGVVAITVVYLSRKKKSVE